MTFCKKSNNWQTSSREVYRLWTTILSITTPGWMAMAYCHRRTSRSSTTAYSASISWNTTTSWRIMTHKVSFAKSQTTEMRLNLTCLKVARWSVTLTLPVCFTWSNLKTKKWLIYWQVLTKVKDFRLYPTSSRILNLARYLLFGDAADVRLVYLTSLLAQRALILPWRQRYQS